MITKTVPVVNRRFCLSVTYDVNRENISSVLSHGIKDYVLAFPSLAAAYSEGWPSVVSRVADVLQSDYTPSIEKDFLRPLTKTVRADFDKNQKHLATFSQEGGSLVLRPQTFGVDLQIKLSGKKLKLKFIVNSTTEEVVPYFDELKASIINALIKKYNVSAEMRDFTKQSYIPSSDGSKRFKVRTSVNLKFS